MTDDSNRECGGEVNHSSSMSNPDPSRAALADKKLWKILAAMIVMYAIGVLHGIHGVWS